MSGLTFLVAFAGGVFGAMVGGTIAFIFSGFFAVLGIAYFTLSGDAVFIDQFAFGTFFGPQTSFVGGVAASAWLGRTKNDPQIGRDVLTPLANHRDLGSLLSGGIFGVGGYLMVTFLQQISPPIDAIALTVVLMNVLARVFLAQSPIFCSNLDWRSWRMEFKKHVCYDFILSFCLSLGVAYSCLLTQQAALGWGISALTLLVLYGGKHTSDIPATHHVSMIAGYVAMASNNILFAAFVGATAYLTGKAIEYTNNIGMASHIDMPATVIALFSLPIFILQLIF